MALEIPTWLNLCFMEEILQKSKNDNSIQVIDIFLKSATNKGDNYSSDMIRVNVTYSHDQSGRKIMKKKSFIVKIAPTVEGIRKDLITKSRVFNTEMSMMTDTLNKMNKLIHPKYRLSGKAIYVQDGNPTLLVLEDLAPLGYRLGCRQSGLDLDHCMLVMRGLARFHATSVALCEKEPNQKQIYTRRLFSDEYPHEIRTFFSQGTKQLAEEMENWSGMKKYAEKVAKLIDNIYKIGIEACKFCENDFNVIIHGDCWVNNIMFKYNDDGKPIDQIFVDFQICSYSSATLDLLYFFNTSPSQDVLDKNTDTLYNEYLDTLSVTMKQLNCKTKSPTKEELKVSMEQRASFGMIISMTVLPVMMSDKDEAKSLDEINESHAPGYKNELYKKNLMKKMPMYDELHLLDI